MSTHHEIEHEQESPPQAASSVHEQETVQEQAVPRGQPSPPPSRLPTRRRFTVGYVAIAVLLVLAVSIGAVIAVQLSQPHAAPATPTPNPTTTAAATGTPVPSSTPGATATPLPGGQWVQFLSGYRVTQLLAAPSQPNVLYACASAPSVEYQGVQTVMRSADFGATWQDIGKRAQMSRGCELTINPGDSYEIYVATSSNPPQNPMVPSYVLEHTSNGGDSWETIHPIVVVPSLNVAFPWQGTQLRFAGNRLYSVQAVPSAITPIPPEKQALARILVSADGGRTWNMLDTQLAAAGRSVEAYLVTPANSKLIYELAYVPVVPGTGFPSLELYRSIDGGATWQPILQHMPWISLAQAAIAMGSENAEVIYLTGTRCSAAQAMRGGREAASLPLAGSSYSVCMSSDGGKSWRTVTAPSQFAQTMGGGVVDQVGRLYTQVPTSGAVEVWRYDPAAGTWSEVTQAPQEGTVLAATAAGANGAAALWLMSTGGKAALYRYVL